MSHTKFIEEKSANIVEECDHEWIWHSDWYGDPDVINGTADCSCWRCELCGEEKLGNPPEYDFDD